MRTVKNDRLRLTQLRSSKTTNDQFWILECGGSAPLLDILEWDLRFQADRAFAALGYLDLRRKRQCLSKNIQKRCRATALQNPKLVSCQQQFLG
jgi:hypothetical protein